MMLRGRIGMNQIRTLKNSDFRSITNIAAAAEYKNFSHKLLTIQEHRTDPNEITSTTKKNYDKDQLVFGRQFTPHMLQIHYNNQQWHEPKILPYTNLSISPAASGLHYGLQCFEGMKAYKPLQPLSSASESNNDKDMTNNEIRLFRPEKNMQRLATSMKRLGMPGYDFDANELIQCISSLVRIDESYIPTCTTPGYALYLRPTVIATHPFLGLCPPEQLLLYVICSPVGPYYTSSGFAPIKLITSSKEHVRAWPGGTGINKIGGNYAGTMLAQQYAIAHGYEQVLWLLDDNITEVGSMNVFFVMVDPNDPSKVELITPPLSRGDILPGVTRDSVIQLARNEWCDDVTVVERNITMSEVIDAIQKERLREAFGTGTAAVVTSIQSIHYNSVDYTLPTTSGDVKSSLTKRVWDTLTGIQYGSTEGPKGWSVLI